MPHDDERSRARVPSTRALSGSADYPTPEIPAARHADPTQVARYLVEVSPDRRAAINAFATDLARLAASLTLDPALRGRDDRPMRAAALLGARPYVPGRPAACLDTLSTMEPLK